MIESEPARGG